MREDQSFEQYLYSQMCWVFPETTVRSFSAALGKSAGYWSSVCAQGLKVSNAALLHLMDHLECKKIRLGASTACRNGIEKIQRQITEELLGRLDLDVNSQTDDSTSEKWHATVQNEPLGFIFSQRYFS
jgi:hypothetical protein